MNPKISSWTTTVQPSPKPPIEFHHRLVRHSWCDDCNGESESDVQVEDILAWFAAQNLVTQGTILHVLSPSTHTDTDAMLHKLKQERDMWKGRAKQLDKADQKLMLYRILGTGYHYEWHGDRVHHVRPDAFNPGPGQLEHRIERQATPLEIDQRDQIASLSHRICEMQNALLSIRQRCDEQIR